MGEKRIVYAEEQYPVMCDVPYREDSQLLIYSFDAVVVEMPAEDWAAMEAAEEAFAVWHRKLVALHEEALKAKREEKRRGR